MAFVEWSAAMLRPTKDGSSRRDYLQASADRGNVTAIEALTPPEVPLAMVHLWHWWTELSGSRQQGMHGLAPITYRDVVAWANLTERDPDPYEVDVLFRMDAAFRHVVSVKEE